MVLILFSLGTVIGCFFGPFVAILAAEKCLFSYWHVYLCPHTAFLHEKRVERTKD